MNIFKKVKTVPKEVVKEQEEIITNSDEEKFMQNDEDEIVVKDGKDIVEKEEFEQDFDGEIEGSLEDDQEVQQKDQNNGLYENLIKIIQDSDETPETIIGMLEIIKFTIISSSNSED